jgi:TolA-binding protein
VTGDGLPTGACPDPLDITRAVSRLGGAQPAEPLRSHLRGCASCREQWQAESEMARLARHLAREAPAESPAADRRRRVLAGTVAAARAAGIRSVGPAEAPPRARVPQWALRIAAAAAAVAVVVMVTLGVWTLRAPAPPAVALVRPPAVIDARPGTRYTVLAGPPHERVRLEAGSLRISVEPATRGETFQVITARGEVEVRGTVFETVASAAGLVAVRVERGKVVVRPDRGHELAIPAGGEWRRPPEPPPRTPAPGSAAAAPAGRRAAARVASAAGHAAAATPPAAGRASRPAHASPSSPSAQAAQSWGPDPGAPSGTGVLRRMHGPAGSPGGAGERDTPDQLAAEAFGEGMTLMRAGALAQAARAFERVAWLSPASPMVEEARYWRAVALARVGNKAAAEAALDGFLTDYPLSPRAGEVSVMLGWLLLDSRPAAAEPRFQAALGDRSPRVRQSARDGLAALRSAAGRP